MSTADKIMKLSHLKAQKLNKRNSVTRPSVLLSGELKNIPRTVDGLELALAAKQLELESKIAEIKDLT